MKSITKLLVAAAFAASPVLVNAAQWTFDLAGNGGSGLLSSNENPVNSSTGFGGEVGSGITYDDVSNRLFINIAWGSANGFGDLTGPVTAIHLHSSISSSPATGNAAFSQNGSVFYALNNSGGRGLSTFDLSANDGFVNHDNAFIEARETQLFNGQFYINIHTAANPNGEIRANLVNAAVIPEPSAFAAIAGLAGLALASSRRRRAA